MITMQDRWHAPARQHIDFRQTDDSVASHRDGNGSFLSNIDEPKNQQRLIGDLLERSISAPPSDIGFDIGRGEGSRRSLLFGLDREPTTTFHQQNKSNDDILIGSSGWNGNINSFSSTGVFFNVEAAAAEPVTSSFETGADSIFPNTERTIPSSSSFPQLHQKDFGSLCLDSSRFGNAAVGRSIARSQSANPERSESLLPSRPPPGMSTSSCVDGEFGGSFLFDRSNMIKEGLRRPASTGVIGQYNTASLSVMESLGLGTSGPKTLMDQIQEDFPKTPSPVYANLPYQNPSQADRSNRYTEAAFRPGAAPAPHSSSRMESLYDQHRLVHQTSSHRQTDDSISYSMQNTQLGKNSTTFNSSERSAAANYPYGLNQVSQSNHDFSRQTTGVATMPHQISPRGMYSSISGGHQMGLQPHQGVSHISHHNPHIVHQNSLYEAQTMYYSTQQVGSPGVGDQIPPRVLHTAPNSSHAVYLNSAPYGYTTVQYHHALPPHHQHGAPRSNTHHLDSHVQTSPHQQELILPVQGQGGGPPRVAGVSPDGTFVYWQQPTNINTVSPAGTPQTVTVMNVHGQPMAMAVASMTPSSMGSPHSSSSGRHNHGQKNSYNSCGKGAAEKGQGRNRRGGAAGGRRGGSALGAAEAVKHSAQSNMTSAVLEEFRSAKNRSWTMEDIRGHIVEFCQDQNGSRFIQQRLEIADEREKTLVLSEALPSVRRLRNDVFGNYVVQKLFEHGTPQMKAELRNTLKHEMLSLSMQMYGCRVVQKALETLDERDLPALLTEFHGNVLVCIHDQDGNHVIQKCVEVMSTKAKLAKASGDEIKADFASGQIQFIVDTVLESVASLSCHPYGCRVLQRILEHCVEAQKTRTLDEISKCHRHLLDDQYGNYVIQHVLHYGRNCDRDSILKIIVESGLLALSRQKFASNVVEKLLKYGTPSHRNGIVREMLKEASESTGEDDSQRSSVVLLMVRDAYANYVVQTAIDVVAEGEEKRLLLEELNKNSAQLRNFTFAKHIVTKLGT